MAKTVTFLQSFTTLPDAEDFQKRIKGPSIIIHLWREDGKDLFALVSAADAKWITDEIDRVEVT